MPKGQLQLMDGAMLRDDAIGRVEENACPEWLTAAFVAVRRCADNKEWFTTDDVWHLLDCEQPREPRAMGAVMAKAFRTGVAEPSNRTRVSRRPVCHRRPLTIWRSLVYRADRPPVLPLPARLG